MLRYVKWYVMIALAVSLVIYSIYLIGRNKDDTSPSQKTYTASEQLQSSDSSDSESSSDSNSQNSESAESSESKTDSDSSSEDNAQAKDMSITFNFVGDCTLGNYCGEYTPQRFCETADRVPPEYFFDGVRDILEKGTFNITNCEGVFTDRPLEEIYKDYDPAFWFKSAAKNAQIFSVNGFQAVGIDNNHIGDYGEEGIEDTKKALEKYGVKWCDMYNPVVLEKDGIKIALFCFSMWNEGVPEIICDQIKEYSETTDIQIAFYHGGTENVHEPDAYKFDYTHKFVDAGADLVVGSHPHVLQPLEVYNGVNILYSLGNFVYGGHTNPENRTIVYTQTFNMENKKIKSTVNNITPCYIFTGDINEFQPVPIEDEDVRQRVLDFMNWELDSPL